MTLLAIVFLVMYKPERERDSFMADMDRAEKYLEEASRFGDKRYIYNAHDVLQRVLASDSLNERALFLMTAVLEDSGKRGEVYQARLQRHFPSGIYTRMRQAADDLGDGNRPAALKNVRKALEIDSENKEALEMLCAISLLNGDYVESWQAAEKYKRLHKEALNDILSSLFLEIGDFKEAEHYLNQKRQTKEFSCYDLESLQRIRLCAGDFERLERETDSICQVTQCDDCAYWQMRARVHTGKVQEARRYVAAALQRTPKIAWRLPAYVLLKSGNADSAMLIAETELAYDREKLVDSTYKQAIPLYSMAAIYAMKGQTKESLNYIRKYADAGFEMGSEWYMAHDPLFDEAQNDKEFFADFMQVIQKAQARKNALREKIRSLE